MSERLAVTYELTCGPGEEAAEKAGDIAVEQTVELPPGAYPSALEESVVGRIEELTHLEGARHRAVITFDVLTIGGEVTQLLNLLFGNISMKRGIRIVAVRWPVELLAGLPGPRFGIGGLRELTGARPGRALTCAALKPMGLGVRELADRCHDLAAGGMDIIKDDHGIANQVTAPFSDRVAACQEAISRANAATGGRSLYFPNLTGPHEGLSGRLEAARAAGCAGALVSPLLMGADTVRWLAEHSGLALLLHPSLAGAFFGADHGIAPDVLLGQLFRLVGGDGVIYCNVGGRFPFDQVICEGINERLREPLGAIRPSMPVPGGGISVARVPFWMERYGPDTMFLIGGSLYAQGDLRRAAADLRDAVERFAGAPSRPGA